MSVSSDRSGAIATAVWYALLLAVATAAIYVRLNNQEVAQRTPDEEIYLAYATRVAESGVGSVRELVADYNRTLEAWIYPPPTRIGSILLIAEVMKATGAPAENAAVWVSRGFSVFGLVILVLLGLQCFDRWVVLIALAFQSVSPLDLALADRAWQDSMVAGVGVFLLYLCLRATGESQRPRWRICFWIVACYFLLIKELALVVYALLAGWLVIDVGRRRRSWKALASVMLPSGFVVLLSYGALSGISGDPRSLFEVYRHMGRALSWSEYSLLYQRGPWYSFPLGLWVLSPATTLLCALGMGRMLFNRDAFGQVLDRDERQMHSGFAVVLFILAVLIAATIPSPFKNLRYIAVVQIPISLVGALFVIFLAKAGEIGFLKLGRRLMPGIVVVTVVVVCVTDYARFQRIFVQYQLDDLAIVRVVNYALAAGGHQNAAPTEAAVELKTPPADASGSPARATAEYQLSRSQSLVQQGLYWNAIQAATAALRLKPSYAEAWNNIGVAYNGLGQFEKGAAACEEALRLRPDFELARNNLQYARRMSNLAK